MIFTYQNSEVWETLQLKEPGKTTLQENRLNAWSILTILLSPWCREQFHGGHGSLCRGVFCLSVQDFGAARKRYAIYKDNQKGE